MSFARDFHICECGHLRRKHSSNFPRTRCLANCDCECLEFKKMVGRKKVKTNKEKQPSISFKEKNDTEICKKHF